MLLLHGIDEKTTKQNTSLSPTQSHPKDTLNPFHVICIPNEVTLYIVRYGSCN